MKKLAILFILLITVSLISCESQSGQRKVKVVVMDTVAKPSTLRTYTTTHKIKILETGTVAFVTLNHTYEYGDTLLVSAKNIKH